MSGTVTINGKMYKVVLEEMNSPTAPLEEVVVQQGGKKTKKAKGTRKLSGYMKFAQEARPRILKDNPDMKSDIPGMGRKIGEMWRALSDSEKAKY